MNRTILAVLGVIVVVAGILASSALFTVRQTEQVIVLQFGDPRRVIQDPGLHAKIPFIQNIVRYDKRLLAIDPDAEEVILNDQKRIILDAFARYRITDPLRFFRTVRTESTFGARFGRVLNSSVRSVVARQSLSDLLSAQRGTIMRDIFDATDEQAGNFGIDLVDIRIGRSELPEDVSQNVYDRMRTERDREANLLRAEGEENSRRIRAIADRQQTVIIAEAERESQILRGAGDAQRNLILGEAYGRDPEFFDFYRSLEAYRDSFNPEDTTMVLSPQGDFFRYFGDITGGAGTLPPVVDQVDRLPPVADQVERPAL